MSNFREPVARCWPHLANPGQSWRHLDQVWPTSAQFQVGHRPGPSEVAPAQDTHVGGHPPDFWPMSSPPRSAPCSHPGRYPPPNKKRDRQNPVTNIEDPRRLPKLPTANATRAHVPARNAHPPRMRRARTCACPPRTAPDGPEHRTVCCVSRRRPKSDQVGREHTHTHTHKRSEAHRPNPHNMMLQNSAKALHAARLERGATRAGSASLYRAARDERSLAAVTHAMGGTSGRAAPARAASCGTPLDTGRPRIYPWPE